MTKKELAEIADEQIDRNREKIFNFAGSIIREPEEGFREEKTAAKVKALFDELNIEYRDGLAVTGIKGVLTGGREGPTVAILAELDAIINRDHPLADQESGAVHACGHFAQLAQLIGSAIGLKDIMKELAGRVVFFAVPSEEYINLEFRQQLKDDGRIKYFGGKQELIYRGEFDDIDLIVMQHAQSEYPGKKAFISAGSNGFIGKRVRFLGRAAHAGVAPFKGINALNAFNIALAAIHAQRETFKDEDRVRVHPIITKGGDSVNVVPGEVIVEFMVRASSVEAIKETSSKVDLALKAGAMAVGARVEITNTPGYLPIENNEELTGIWTENAVQLLGRDNVFSIGAFGGSTDMGDLTQIKPGIHPYVGSFSGDLHSKNFK
ncbi:MAG: amidohydrolase, partial [Spirochaeta sp.]|nr:amidohydrolase [Spirochaeta sp.]